LFGLFGPGGPGRIRCGSGGILWAPGASKKGGIFKGGPREPVTGGRGIGNRAEASCWAIFTGILPLPPTGIGCRRLGTKIPAGAPPQGE